MSPPQGLGDQPAKEWPSTNSKSLSVPAIDRLKPGSTAHDRVKDYLLARLNLSENQMTRFHARWRLSEMRHQAYINLPDYEKALKNTTSLSGPPEITSIVVPYSWATINTIVTYLVNAFTGRKPMFQLGANNPNSVKPAEYQELVLQQNADHTRLVRHLYQTLLDGQIYGVSVLRTIWKKDSAMRTVMKPTPTLLGSNGAPIKTREMRVTYEGNDVMAIDPFMFFPDPRVPMIDVATRGEFVFWRTYDGRHMLLTEEKQGRLKWVANAGTLPRDSVGNDLNRNRLAGEPADVVRGDSRAGASMTTVQVDQGTVNLIPAELGLGPETYPVRWLFTLLNKTQIAQAQPLEYDHDHHPVSVSEPYTMGYGFGQAGMADLLAPIQDSLSWFVNSHIYNVRAALNNMFVVDPSRVEMQDFKKGGPGRIIRLKQLAMGQDVNTAIQQLQVVDVTRSHVADFETFMKMGDILSAVNDNLRGTQDPGGRKSATEVRTAGEASASRLASLARLISSQQMVDLAEQMSINVQQFMSQEFFARIVGEKGAMENLSVTPDMVIGDFYYPVHDGTLPLDKVALLDVWREIFQTIVSTPPADPMQPPLSAQFNIMELFTFMAELAGAKNIDKFKIQAMPDPMVDAAAQAGNMLPLNGGLDGLPIPPGAGSGNGQIVPGPISGGPQA